MGVRAVVQPNGLFARFSEVVDHFTDINMTEPEAMDVFRNECGSRETANKIDRAKENPGRYKECIRIIKRVHGKEEVEQFERELTEDQQSLQENQS